MPQQTSKTFFYEGSLDLKPWENIPGVIASESPLCSLLYPWFQRVERLQDFLWKAGWKLSTLSYRGEPLSCPVPANQPSQGKVSTVLLSTSDSPSAGHHGELRGTKGGGFCQGSGRNIVYPWNKDK